MTHAMTKQPPRHESSDGATVRSQLRFGRVPPKGASNGTSTSTTQKSRFDTTDDPFGDVELSRTEKAVPVGDEEAQSHKIPG